MMNVAWTCLVLAGLLEIGWPLGLQMAQVPGRAVWAIPFAIVCMAASGALLLMSLKQVPMGTAYAVWSGIGASGTFLVGIAVFEEPTSALRFLGVGFVIAGVAMLKLSH
jgi:quaternary ammonium compound-resistance protein SugE